MNILFCGDRYIEDGLMIAISSLMRNIEEPLHIFILTMEITTKKKQFLPVSVHTVAYLDNYVKTKNPESTVTLQDITELFCQNLPKANMGTRFTPYCMLRLFADQLDEIPDRILYLDVDIICRQSLGDFYYQDMDEYELAGVLDYYGRWFFRRDFFHMDYINSGVLLLNTALIRKTDLFTKCRARCQKRRMFMPDQTAINKLTQAKKLCSRKYNEQHLLQQDTVVQHFTTAFRFFPVFHPLTVKPWEIERVHQKLKLFEYDDLLEEYKILKSKIEE